MIAESVEIAKEERTLDPLLPEIIALLGAVVSTIIIVLPLQVFLGMFLGGIPLIENLPAPLTEEPFKALGIMYLAFVYPGVLKTKKDGFRLGFCAAAGFIFVENFKYAIQVNSDINILIRAIMPASVHILATGLIGIGLVIVARRQFDHGTLKISTIKEQLLTREVLLFFALSMTFHFLYNSMFIFGGLGLILDIGLIAGMAYLVYRIYNYLPDDMSNLKMDSYGSFISGALRSRKPAPVAAPVFSPASPAGAPAASTASPDMVPVQVPVRVRTTAASASTATPVPAPVPAPVPTPTPAPVPVVVAPVPAPAATAAPAPGHQHCTECGTENKIGAHFCSKCGNKL